MARKLLEPPVLSHLMVLHMARKHLDLPQGRSNSLLPTRFYWLAYKVSKRLDLLLVGR